VCCPLDILAQVVSACFTPPKPSKWATGQPGTCQGRNEAYFGCPSWPVRSMPVKTPLVRSHCSAPSLWRYSSTEQCTPNPFYAK
jgi:hypothetical protein